MSHYANKLKNISVVPRIRRIYAYNAAVTKHSKYQINSDEDPF